MQKKLLLDSEGILGHVLTQQDGHVFYIPDPDSIQELVEQTEPSKLLTESQLSFLKAALLEYSKSNSEYITVSQIEVYLEGNRSSINKTITKLNTLTLLKSVEFSLTSGKSLPRTKCYVFPEKSDFPSLFAILNSKKNVIKDNRSKANIHPARNTALASFGLPPTVTNNEVREGKSFILTGLPPFEQLVPDRRYKERSLITQIKLKSQPVIVETKSPDVLMNSDDIKTLFILIALSINAQADMLDYYKSAGGPPINHHYIEIKHIMNALGKSAAGSYYKGYVKSILRIKDTSFDLHMLKSLYVSPEGEPLFVGSDFRFFKSCRPISKKQPVVEIDKDNNQTVKIRPFAFIIEWDETIFEKMLTDSYFFVIPLKILGSSTSIFLFYMTLRNYFSVDTTRIWKLTLEDLHCRLHSVAHIHNFKRDFTISLSAWVEGDNKLPCYGSVTVDLQGFMIKVHMSDDNIVRLDCSVDVAKMLSCAGVKSGKHGKEDRSAPIAHNPLLDLSNVIEFKEQRGDEFPRNKSMRLRLNSRDLLKNINMTKGSKQIITVSKFDYCQHFTFYSDDNLLVSISHSVHDLEEDRAAFFGYLKELRSKLSPLYFGSAGSKIELSLAMFSDILEGLTQSHSMILEADELFELLRNKGHLIKVAATWDGKTSESPLLSKLASLYTEKNSQIPLL